MLPCLLWHLPMPRVHPPPTPSQAQSSGSNNSQGIMLQKKNLHARLSEGQLMRSGDFHKWIVYFLTEDVQNFKEAE